ncbi:condensation domain-containing protein, partial [Aquimarina muelleri]|uniref:condensation domain-containing protein n=2 Tax=Aquimarina muelleri TaxID=279356 RepID=UPI002248B41A
EYVGYRNKTEEELTSIWQELLGVTKIGVYDNFFDLGGHSLLATRLVSMIRKELEVSVSIRDIFNHTSIASLGLHIDTQSQGDILPSIVSEPKEGKIPLSFSQERLWFIDQLEGSVQYHMPVVLQLEGSLSIVDLESSFREIVLRHEILRTVIDTEEGKGYQRVISSDNWQLTKVAITEELLEDHLSDFISTPFDLSSDYMLRMCLYDLGEDTYVLGGVFHHISSDGWSNGILVREFASLYHSFKSG